MCKIPFKSQGFVWNIKLYQRSFNLCVTFSKMFYFANGYRSRNGQMERITYKQNSNNTFKGNLKIFLRNPSINK